MGLRTGYQFTAYFFVCVICCAIFPVMWIEISFETLIVFLIKKPFFFHSERVLAYIRSNSANTVYPQVPDVFY